MSPSRRRTSPKKLSKVDAIEEDAPVVLELAPRPPMFTVNVREIKLFLFAHQKPLLIIAGSMVAFSIFLSFGGHSRASVATFYADKCLGGWEGTEYAEGAPSLGDDAPIEDFTKGNSAYNSRGSSSMYCSGFSGEMPEDTVPKNVSLALFWSIDSGTVVHKESEPFDTNFNEGSNGGSSSGDEGSPSEIENTDTLLDSDVEIIEIPSDSVERPILTPDDVENSGENTDQSVQTSEPTSDETPPPEEESVTEDEPSVVSLLKSFFAKQVYAQEEVATEEVVVEEAPKEEPEEPEPVAEAEPESVEVPEEVINIVEENTETEPLGEEVDVVDSEITEGRDLGDLTEVASVVVEEIISDLAIEEESSGGSGEITSVEPSADSVITLKYTLDGITWYSLGGATLADWKNKTFDIPIKGIEKWSDLENFQISFETPLNIDLAPAIYIDAIALQSEYEGIEQQILPEAPTIQITDPTETIIVSAESNESAIDGLTFDIIDPEYTPSEVVALIDQGKAIVLLDNDELIDSWKQPLIPEGETKDSINSIKNIISPIIEEQIVSSDESKTTDEEIQADTSENENQIEILEGEPLSEDIQGLNVNLEEVVVSPDTGTEESNIPPNEPVEVSLSHLGEALSGMTSNIPQTVKTRNSQFYRDFTNTRHVDIFGVKQVLAQESSITVNESQALPEHITALVLDSKGETNIEAKIITVINNGVAKQKIHIDKPRQFRPGQYTLRVTLRGESANIVSEQNFTWGVLAINIDRSIEEPGNDAYLQFGVLNDAGHSICDADLSLTITGPTGKKYKLDTRDGSIVRDSACGPDNVIFVPDYYAHFTVPENLGEYTMKLVAHTDNGVEQIEDSFEVQENVEFDVVRSGPTRIYPPSSYPVTLRVTAESAWTGVITEEVPASFEIDHPLHSLDYDSVVTKGDAKIISWNVSLTAGEEAVLGYYFNAPDISPELFLIGPLSFVDGAENVVFKELRQWQIASDAVCVAASSGNWTTVTWTNCGAGPTATDSVQIPDTFSVTLDTSTTVDSIDIQNGGTLTNDGNARTLTLDGTSGTLFTLGSTGTFTPSTFITVTMTPDAAITTTSGTITFYNLNLTPTLVTTNRTYTMGSGALTINGNFTIQPDESAAGTPVLTVAMGADITGSATTTTTISRSNSATSLLDTRPASTDYNISTGLMVIGTGGTLDATSSASTLTLTGTSGTLFTKTGTYTITSGTPTVAVTSASGTPTLLSAATTFYDLTINSTATIINQGAFAPTINHNFTLTAGVFNNYGASLTTSGANAFTLSSGTTLCLGGLAASTLATCDNASDTATDSTARQIPTFSSYSINSNSTVKYMSNAAFTITMPTGGYGNLSFLPVISAARTWTLPNGLTVSGNFISNPLCGSGCTANRILTLTQGTGTTAITGTVTLRGRTNSQATPRTSSTTLAVGANTLSVSSSIDIQVVTVASVLSCSTGTISTTNVTVAGRFTATGACTFNLTGTSGTLLTRTGTFTQSTSTVAMKPNASVTLTSGTVTFYNLDLVPVVTTSNITYTFGAGAITIASAGRFTINPTATDASSNAILEVDMGANITVNANATTTIKATQVSSSTVTSVLDAVSGSNRALSTGFLAIQGGGGYTAQASTITLTGITAAATLFSLTGTGTFTAGTSTVTTTGVTNSNIINSSGFTGSNALYNLTINSTAVTKSLGAALTVTNITTVTLGTLDLDVTNNYALTTGFISIANSASAIFLARASTITITGTTTTTLLSKGASGVFTQGTSTVQVTSASGPLSLLAVAQTFHILIINSSSSSTVVNARFAITIADASGSKLYVQSGVLNDSGLGIATSASTQNTLEIGASGTLCLGGASGTNSSVTCNSSAASTTTRAMPAFFTYTFDVASTVIFMSDAATTVSNTPTYGNLKLTPVFVSTARTYTLAGAMTINGNFTITPEETGAGTPALTVNAGGTITVATGKLTTVSRANSATAILDMDPGTDYDLSTGTLNVGTGGTLDYTNNASATGLTLTDTTGTLFTLAGTFTITGGTFTTTLSGNGSATINSGAIIFYNLTSSGTGIKTVASALTVTNTLAVSAGTFFPNAVTSAVTGSGGSNTMTISGTGILQVDGSLFTDTYPGFETINFNSGSTVQYNRGGTQTILENASITGTSQYANLILSNSNVKSLNGTTTVTGLTTITGTATLSTVTGVGHTFTTGTVYIDSAATLTIRNSSTVTFTGTSGPVLTLIAGGTMNWGTTTTAVFNGNATMTLVSGEVSSVNAFRNVTLSPTLTAGNDRIYTLSDDAIAIDGDFTINPTTASGTPQLTVNLGGDLVVKSTVVTTITATSTALSVLDTDSVGSYAFSTGTLVIGAGGTFAGNGSTVTITGSASPLVTLDASGVLTSGTSTFTFTNDVDLTLTSGTFTSSNSFYNVVLSPVIASAKTYTWGAGAVEIAGDFTSNSSGANALNIDLGAGGLTVGGLTTLTGTSSGFAKLDTTTSDYTFSSGRVDIATSSTLNIRASTFTLTGTSGTILTRSGTFTAGDASTTIFNGNASITLTSGAFTGSNNFGNVTLSPNFIVTPAKTYTFGSGAIEIAGNFTINPNAAIGRLLTVDMGADITVATTGTTTITKTGSATSLLDVRPSGTDYALSTGILTIASGGTLDATSAASTITVADDWTNAGTFTAGSSTVLLNTAATATVTGTTTFYNLTITHTSAKEINFATAGTPIFHVTNTFTVAGNTGQLIKLYSDSGGTQWQFHPTGTAAVDYADVKDGGCESGSITMAPTNTTDSYNNDSCWGLLKTLTFDIDTEAGGGSGESTTPYSVTLGTITTTDTRVSGTGDGIQMIVLEGDTNAPGGMVVVVRSSNGANGLVSTSVSGDDIDSADGAMADGTENYGLCVATSGLTGFSRASPYDSGTCAVDTETNNIQGLTTIGENILNSGGVELSAGHAEVIVNAAVSGVTTGHNDYTDTLTFIATGTF
jgi:hypothetical protein